MPDAMDWRDIVRTRFAEITGDAARDEDIVEELAQHLAQRFDEARREGMTADEALALAVSELRDSGAIRRAIAEAERVRPAAPVPPPASRTRWLPDLGLDLRYAARLLRRAPGFTSAALLTMTLGIGMTASIFSVVQAVLLEPVPFADADRLQMVWQTDRSSGTVREPGSIPDFFDYVERSRTIDRFGGFGAYEANLQPQRGDPVRLGALAATSGFLDLLGVHPIAGRTFTADEYRPGGPFAVLISERLWETLFDRDASVIGTALRLNERPATVVGIVPANADFGVLQMLSSAAYSRGFADRDARTRVDVWSPIQPNPATAPRDGHGLLMIGRLRPGATLESARDEMTRIAADLERTYPVNDARGVFLEPLQEVIFGRVRTPLAVLLAAVVLVLLISCVNVANLLIARGAARAREIAVRAALGADTSRLVRQFAVENILLMLLAAALGVGFAYASLSTLVRIGPPTIPRLADVALDTRVLMLTFGVSVCVGFVFGFFPVTRIQGARLRSTLVVIQVATAVVLVTAAGLLIRSFWLIQRTDPGFDVSGVLKAEVPLPAARYPVDFRRATPGFGAFDRFKDDLIERVAALPGVEAVAMAGSHPLDAGFTTSFAVIGREAEAASLPELPVRTVTPGYFAVMRVPLVQGRLLEEADATDGRRAVVINQALADRFFPNETALGHRLRFFGPTEWTIVGIVGGERFHGITNAAPIAAYVMLSQAPLPMPALLVRTSGDPASLAAPVRSVIREIDPALAAFAIEPLQETLANSLSQQRFLMLLLGVFALLALTLAAIGVHGVLSYVVARRTKEIGVRMSLGADAGHVVRLIVRQGAALTVIGLVTGAALTLASSRWLAGLLYGITPTDAVTLFGVVVVLGVVAAVSTWLPARRAVRIDPLAALRQE